MVEVQLLNSNREQHQLSFTLKSHDPGNFDDPTDSVVDETSGSANEDQDQDDRHGQGHQQRAQASEPVAEEEEHDLPSRVGASRTSYPGPGRATRGRPLTAPPGLARGSRGGTLGS